jgi:hypothetical protein
VDVSPNEPAPEHRPVFEGSVAFHEHVALTRATRDARPNRNVSVVFELRGAVDIAALGRAVRWLAARHEGLRSGFVATTDSFRREVFAPRLDLEILDLRAAPTQARAVVEGRVCTVFPLDRAPLASMTLILLEPERALFVAVVDHVVMDFYAALLALRHLGDAYGRFVAGSVPALAPAPQPREIVAELAAWLAPALAQRSAWAVPWPADGFTLLSDPTRPGGCDPGTGLLVAPLPSRWDLQVAATREGVSGAALVVAAFATSLRGVCGRSDVGFSLARTGRHTARQRHTVASLVYTDTFTASAAVGRDLVAEAERFVRDESPWRRMYNALVAPPTRRILLNLLGPSCRLSLTGVVATERRDLLPPPQLFDAHDLVVQLAEVQGSFLVFLAYRTCWLEAETAGRLLAGFVDALSTLLRTPEAVR